MVSISRKLFYKDHMYRNISYTKNKVYKVRVITIVIKLGGASASQLLINRERVFKKNISEYNIINKKLLFTDFSI
jgi:hypothetical protein